MCRKLTHCLLKVCSHLLTSVIVILIILLTNPIIVY